MKYLVTGTSGHLGEALVRTLRERGDDVTGLDVNPSPFTDIVGSVVDPDVVADAMHGVTHVIHAATLHKPHVATHSMQDFIDTNVSGTLTLLEAAVREGVAAFVFTSTTSVFGESMRPGPGDPAVWVTEELVPVPKNIYGVTKVAAENICGLVHKRHGLPIVILRTSRFFPEDDDNAEVRARFPNGNVKANEYLYRRADVADMVGAHLCAVERAPGVGFDKLIVSATTPFTQQDLHELRGSAPAVVGRLVPGFEAAYARAGFQMFDDIERVYVNDKARRVLDWQPQFNFDHVVDCLAAGRDPRSPLAVAIGSKGYHDEVFVDGPYPVEEGH